MGFVECRVPLILIQRGIGLPAPEHAHKPVQERRLAGTLVTAVVGRYTISELHGPVTYADFIRELFRAGVAASSVPQPCKNLRYISQMCACDQQKREKGYNNKNCYGKGDR